MSHKKIIGILLAGGMGSRLKELTDTVPKPALNFGAKYRIIDFVLSNCANSGIDTIGVITQYEPIELTSYIGSGGAWDLDVVDGGITVLPPYTSKLEGFYWQKGTAHAVYQHINYMDLYEPEYVLILSTDHIYKMDYNDLIMTHESKSADCTIPTITVPEHERSRFGVLEADADGQVTSFIEKPIHPTSGQVSMGIYLFNYQVLKETLIKFNNEGYQEIDFGKHIIPYLIDHYKVYRDSFDGYWRDIGTIEALWQANMELIDNRKQLDLWDKRWTIFSNSTHLPAHHAFPTSIIQNSILAEGSMILGKVFHSVVSSGVLIEQNSTIIDSVIMPNVHVGKNCFLKNAIVKMNLSIPDGTIIDHNNGVILVTESYLKEVR